MFPSERIGFLVSQLYADISPLGYDSLYTLNTTLDTQA